jgi:hypothetical protein
VRLVRGRLRAGSQVCHDVHGRCKGTWPRFVRAMPPIPTARGRARARPPGTLPSWIDVPLRRPERAGQALVEHLSPRVALAAAATASSRSICRVRRRSAGHPSARPSPWMHAAGARSGQSHRSPLASRGNYWAACALRFAPVRSSGFRIPCRERAVELVGGGGRIGDREWGPVPPGAHVPLKRPVSTPASRLPAQCRDCQR